MLLKHLLYNLLLVTALLSNCGCVAALLIGGGAGAGTVAYLKGELTATVEAPIDRACQAAQKATKDLAFIITSKEHDALSAKLVAYGANDTKMEINLEKVSENLTRVKIRVGVFGDESLSRLTLERIQKNL